jgi:hypothetical protein
MRLLAVVGRKSVTVLLKSTGLAIGSLRRETWEKACQLDRACFLTGPGTAVLGDLAQPAGFPASVASAFAMVCPQPLQFTFQGGSIQLSDLPSFHHPADQGSRGEANRKRRRNRECRVSLQAPGCVIQEFFGGIAALLCGAPRYTYAVLDCIGNRIGCTRSLMS